MAIFLRHSSNVKPPMWPIDPGIVWLNCQRMGLPMPVGLWQMWEGSGNKVYDLSGNGNDGTISSGSWEAGGIKFDAADTKINCGSGPSLDSAFDGGPITIIARVRRDGAFELENDGAIVKKDHALKDEFFYNAALGRLYFRLDYAATNVNGYYSVALANGKWYTLGVTYPGNGAADSTMRFYVDSVGYSPTWTRGGPAGAKDDNSALDLYIGNNRYTQHTWNGPFEHVCIFNQALNPTQVATLHADPHGMVRQPDAIAMLAAAQAEVEPFIPRITIF